MDVNIGSFFHLGSFAALCQESYQNTYILTKHQLIKIE